jgi:hypothetical protein
VAVVINAIGPFVYDPAPLLGLCEAAGADYVDLAGEPAFLTAVGSWCRRPGVSIAVCAGASTIPGLIELTALHLVERLDGLPSRFEVFLSMGSANPLTPGMLASLTLPLGMPLHSPDGAVAYRELRLHELRDLGERLFGRYPAPFDAEGLRVGERRFPARFWVGLDRRWIVQALRVASYLRPCFSERGWLVLMARLRPLVGQASRFGSYPGGMRVEAIDAAHKLLGAVDYFAARDGLTIPALPPVWAAKALPAGASPGYHALSELVTFGEASASLRSYGFEVNVE